ncbi:DTW domain-containing protein [Pusillimonas sp. MFBS29]|uniref:tRNA-uridine aminocarboxypropyltransferase n=1 Tax=Pusillimonas sp. MFBS29 TaxID=2886690 RepID=UPI001D12DE46|nr:tRNA-uridine aminocarboxypropyltransferase [Pusillimonas sp. MFBS29]MCC2597163.1 DTW domain-containing protein [Pusillimonas sp. MFBS29]
MPRPRCEHCQRPASHCLCAYISCTPNRTHVLVLQHPDEANHALNTARLAVAGLLNARLLVGEHFPQLAEIIASAEHALLLFPDRGDDRSLVPKAQGERSLLIVPDGTWRKARKILAANPVLDTLPRLTLPPGAPSEYRIRKTRQPGAVSTIEAIARSLSLLEPDQSFERLLTPFRMQIAQQVQAMGEEVYRHNYPAN